MRHELTGLVLTFNGARLLEKCLASLDFCGSILVVDSMSSDATPDIVRAAAAKEEPGRIRLIQRPWPGPGAQFAFAFEHIETPWVFSLDQDELCSPVLRASILAALDENEKNPAGPDGYYSARRSWYYNRFMQHSGWYPDRLLRLFKNGRMEVHVSGAHYSFRPLGTTGRLDGDILHYPYANFSQHLDKVNDYAQKGAADLAVKGEKGGVLRGLGHGLGRFFKLYVFKLGFLDGRAGFINAVHGAFYAFAKYVRVDEGGWGAPFDGGE